MSDDLAACRDLGSSRVSDFKALFRRRVIFGSLAAATIAAFALWFSCILAAGAIGFLDVFLLLFFLLHTTWLTLGFWNAIIGFYLLRTSPNLLKRVAPPLANAPEEAQICERTAIVMTIRNEDAGGVFARLDAMKTSLDRTPFGAQFDYFILSDSSIPQLIDAEMAACSAFRARHGDTPRIVYRRRAANVGFKPGNVRDFCDKWGGNYDFMVLLDADSLMRGETLLRLVRIMQANPRLGVLQTLIVGALMPSFFAQVFEFGHRLGMICTTVGAVWWQGERCQYWGHNAIIRLAPFIEYCRLQYLPGRGPFAGHIICHDQIEASLMQRAGFEVRVLPEESGSYEGVPPTLLEFMDRDHRWFHGNLMNLRLLKLLQLPAMSRFHLAVVAQRYLGWVAAVIFALLAAAKAATWPHGGEFPAPAALGLYLAVTVVFLTPRLMGLVHTLLRGARRYGGRRALLVGALTELCFSLILLPISMFAAGRFFVRLLLGWGIKWEAPRRGNYSLRWRSAVAGLWTHCLFAAGLIAYLAGVAPAALLWFAPFLFGLLVAIPFALLTASATVTEWARRRKLCASPEDLEMPIEAASTLAAQHVPARTAVLAASL